MAGLHTPDQIKTKKSRIIAGIIGLVLAYLFLTRAIQTGSWLQYAGFVLLLTLGLRQFHKAFK